MWRQSTWESAGRGDRVPIISKVEKQSTYQQDVDTEYLSARWRNRVPNQQDVDTEYLSARWRNRVPNQQDGETEYLISKMEEQWPGISKM